MGAVKQCKSTAQVTQDEVRRGGLFQGEKDNRICSSSHSSCSCCKEIPRPLQALEQRPKTWSQYRATSRWSPIEQKNHLLVRIVRFTISRQSCTARPIPNLLMFSPQPTRRLCHEPAQAPMSHGSTERGPRSAVLIQVSQRNDWRQQAGRLSSYLLSAGHVPTVNECYGELLTQKTTQAFVFCPMMFLTSRTAVACDFA